MDPINPASEAFRVGPFGGQMLKGYNPAAAIHRDGAGCAGNSANADQSLPLAPLMPKARVNLGTIVLPPTTERFVTLELPLDIATRLRAFLGVLSVAGDRVHQTGPAPERTGLVGVNGPYYNADEIRGAAILTHNALRQAGV